MTDLDAVSIVVWEKEKEKAENHGLKLIVRQTTFYVENAKTEGIYFESRDLRIISTFLSGYTYGHKYGLNAK